ncbi:hypothetical protein O3P69_006670 [Scylla paramamosain]|uniref:Secreted protein n=1 Tax=Scylla paramamosain TaxID=85552 RepID=A0AAW0U0C9_SCYPA
MVARWWCLWCSAVLSGCCEVAVVVRRDVTTEENKEVAGSQTDAKCHGTGNRIAQNALPYPILRDDEGDLAIG